MCYTRGRYFNGATSIVAYDDFGDYYSDVSSNVYGVSDKLPENQIILDQKLYNFFIGYDLVSKDIIKRIVKEIQYGYKKSVVVELIDDWKNLCSSSEGREAFI